MELEFYGAAGEVTGSCHILRANGHQLLLDCGMIQGGRKSEARNHDPFPFDARVIDAVVLSHAHIDHSGRLPLLRRRGFEGPIWVQNATRDLCRVLLLDSAGLQESDARRQNKRLQEKGEEPVEPLYTEADALDTLPLMRGVRYKQWQEVLPGMELRYHDAGHILGSAAVELRVSENGQTRTVVFSGDLGQWDTPILRDPQLIASADMVLMESTYGGRRHRERSATIEEIGEIISNARHSRGNILIPAFAIGRSQEILYQFGLHYDEWQMDRFQIFLDSPMAIEATEIYRNYPNLYDEEAREMAQQGRAELKILERLHLTRSTEESKAINRISGGAIIIAGSGMCSGGRILPHLRNNLGHDGNHVIIVGYQAQGSLGRRLVEREERVKIYGEWYAVRAQIHSVGGLSAHGDQDDLARWYEGFENRPPVWLVHGEEDSGAAFQDYLEQRTGTRPTAARPGMVVDLAALPESPNQ